MGILLGNDLVCLDIDINEDKAKDGFTKVAAFEEELGKLPQTATQTSGSGGRHYLYRTTQPLGRHVTKDPNSPWYGLDVLSGSSFIVAAPSVNANGQYVWDSENLPEKADVTLLPDNWNVRLLEVVSQTSTSGRERNGKAARKGLCQQLLSELPEVDTTFGVDDETFSKMESGLSWLASCGKDCPEGYTWFKILGAIKLAANDQRGLNLACEWSGAMNDKGEQFPGYSDDDVAYHWSRCSDPINAAPDDADFTTIIHFAKEAGMSTNTYEPFTFELSPDHQVVPTYKVVYDSDAMVVVDDEAANDSNSGDVAELKTPADIYNVFELESALTPEFDFKSCLIPELSEVVQSITDTVGCSSDIPLVVTLDALSAAMQHSFQTLRVKDSKTGSLMASPVSRYSIILVTSSLRKSAVDIEVMPSFESFDISAAVNDKEVKDAFYADMQLWKAEKETIEAVIKKITKGMAGTRLAIGQYDRGSNDSANVEELQRQLRNYEVDLEKERDQLKYTLSQKPEKPIIRKILMPSSGSVQGMNDEIIEHRCVYSSSDEAGKIFGSYGFENDCNVVLSNFDSLWTGTKNAILVRLKSLQDSQMLDGEARLAITWYVQPAIFNKFLQDNPTARSIGFMQRVSIIRPETDLNNFRKEYVTQAELEKAQQKTAERVAELVANDSGISDVDSKVHSPEVLKFHKLIKALLRMKMNIDSNGCFTSYKMFMDDEASKLWHDYYELMIDQMIEYQGVDDDLAGFIGKLADKAARNAVILKVCSKMFRDGLLDSEGDIPVTELFEGVVVDAECMKAAIAYGHHELEAYKVVVGSALLSPEMQLAQDLYVLMAKSTSKNREGNSFEFTKAINRGITLRDAEGHRVGKEGFTTCLEILAGHNLVSKTVQADGKDSKGRQRTKDVWAISPPAEYCQK